MLHVADAEQSVQRHGDAVVVRRELGGDRSVLALNLGTSLVELDVEPGLDRRLRLGRGRRRRRAELPRPTHAFPGCTAALLLSATLIKHDRREGVERGVDVERTHRPSGSPSIST